MKKTTTFFKTLLVAVALLVGAGNVWAGETVGAEDFSTGYLAAHSTVKTIANGGSLHYVFTQTKATDANYKGWLLWVGTRGSEVNWKNGISIVRGDNWDDKWPTTNENGDPAYGANSGCTSNFNWGTFNADMNGATVDMTVNYENGTLTMSAAIRNGEKSYSYNYSKNVDGAPTSVDACLSVNAAYLNITTDKIENFETVYTRASVGDWKEDDLSEWGGNSFLTIDKDHGLFFNPTNPATAYSATKTFSVDDNAIIKYDVQWYVGGSTGRDANYEYIQFGDKVRISWNSNYFFYLDVTGTSTTNTSIGTKGGNTTYTKNISIVFNTATKKVESFVFDGIDLASNVSDMLEGDFNKLIFGFQRGGRAANWEFPNGLVTLTVSQKKQEVSIANYTVNYKIGDDVVKTVSSSSVVGAEITADIAVNGEGDFEGNHYLVVADDVPSMILVAGNNELNVPVRAPYKATLNMSTVIGENEPITVATNLVETDEKTCAWSYAYPLYVKGDDGLYYKADNTTTFGESGTFTDGEVIDKVLTFSNVEKSIVYFYDQPAPGTNYAYTNGATSNIAAQNARNRGISVGTLPAGTYMFIANITSANRRSVVLRHSTDDPIAIVGTSNDDQTTGIKSAVFTLDEETNDLFVNGANSGDAKTNQSEDFDYVLIKTAALYTINYTFNGEVVKTISSLADIGAEIVADAAIDVDDNHYLIVADEAPSMTLVADGTSNVLNIPVRKPYTATLKVSTIIGEGEPVETISRLVENDAKETSWYYVYPLYVLDDAGKYYRLDNSNKFGEQGTFNDGDELSLVVSYSLDENVAFFYEETETGKNINYSNGGTCYAPSANTFAGAGIAMGTYGPGMYELVVSLVSDPNRGIYVRNNTETIIANSGIGKNSKAGVYSVIFDLDEETPLNITGYTNNQNKPNQSATVDYIILKKVPATLSKEMSAAGYATYCAPYALNFSNTGLTAYIAKVADGVVSFEEVTEVPANTGVLLKGDAKTYDIPVVASAEAVEGNAFVGVNEATTVDNVGIFVLMNGNEGVGFYKTTKAFTVGAHTAYLPADAAARAFIGFGDEATGISAVSRAEEDGEAIFNLQGLRVGKAVKGLYIKNGKKVIVK